MPQITVNGRQVTVDGSFLRLSPEQQDATVEEIASSVPQPTATERAILAATAPVKAIPSNYNEFVAQGAAKMKNALAALRAEGARMAEQAGSSSIALTPGGTVVPAAIPSVLNPVPAGKTLWNLASGATEIAGAPVAAAYRSIVSQPLENVSHGYLPKEGTEFIGAMAAPELAAPVIRAASNLVRNRLAARPVELTPAELQASAAGHFNAPEVQDVTLHPQAVQQFYENLPKTLETKGHATEVVAPQTYRQVEQYGKSAGATQAPMTIEDLKNQRTIFQGIAQKSSVPQERSAASAAINAIDEFVANPRFANFPARAEITGSGEEAAKALAMGRGDIAAGKSLERLDRKQFIKELRAAATGSGMNIGNSLRQGLVEIMADERSYRNLKPEVRDAIENVVRGTPSENAVRLLGNVLGGGGGIGNMGVRAIGGHVAGPVGYLLPDVGTALRLLSNRMTLEEFDKLRTLIASNSPLARSVQNAMSQYAKAGQSVATGISAAVSVPRINSLATKLSQVLKQAGIQSRPIPVPAQTGQNP